MSTLSNKIDFALVISAEGANVNGDPLDGNRPRANFDGYGEMSDVCIKRKIRNRLQDMHEDNIKNGVEDNGGEIFVVAEDRITDKFYSLNKRAESVSELKKLAGSKDPEERKKYAEIACKKWIDVRSFGQVFAFGKGDGNADGTSVPVRGPVSVCMGKSVSPVDIVDMQIVKSTDSESKTGKQARMGHKYFVEFGVYVIKGSINCQLAEKTGFSDEDAEKIKEALKTLFENDCSAARPDGSMQVCKLVWWKHNGKTPKYSSAKVHGCLKVELKPGCSKPGSFDDYTVTVEELDGLKPEIYDMI